MGEDLAEVDVRQRKSGKNKNPGDEGYSSPGENVHGASKRRRRGRNDKSDGNLSTPEKDVTIEAIDLKGKIGKKREVNVDDGDDGDDYNPLDLDDEESSGSWLFKLVIIAIIVSLGFSLMWFNDGDSARDLGEIVSDGESIDDGVESYVSSKLDDDSDEDRDRGDIGLESDDKSYEDKYQEYQQTSEFQDHSQWNHDYSDSNRVDGEIIAEVSGNLGDSSNEEAEYQVNQNEDYSQSQPEVDQQASEGWSWFGQEPSYQDNSAPQPPSEEVNPTPEADSNPTYYEEQSAPSFEQQAWQYQEQQNEPEQQPTPEQFYEQTQEQAQEPYEPRPDDQQAQPIVDTPEQYDNPPMDSYEPYLETGYFECPEGSHWDGLACVDSNSYGQIDNSNDYVAQPESTTESIIYPEQQ